MDRQHRRSIVAWVADQILPHEADVRAWLYRSGLQSSDVDDIIQQAYCLLSGLSDVDHIDNGRAYFFATVRSVRLQRYRRDRIVPIHVVADLEAQPIVDDTPSPEQIAGGRRRLTQVLAALDVLPKGYREVIAMRRIDGLTQKETAQRLGVSEKVVENNLTRGVKALLKAIERAPEATLQQEETDRDRRHATRH